MKRLFVLILLVGAAILALHQMRSPLRAPAQSPFEAVAVAAEVQPVAIPEAEAEAPSWFLAIKSGTTLPGGVDSGKVIKGRLSATRERALADARKQLDRTVVKDWLAPDVPRSWNAPRPLIDGLIRRTFVTPVASDLKVDALKEFDVVYVGGYVVQMTPEARARLIGVYQREIVAKRLGLLGGILGLVLIGLSGLAGYIRADEATKGYYTNRLRILTAAGVGAASVAFYRWLLT